MKNICVVISFFVLNAFGPQTFADDENSVVNEGKNSSAEKPVENLIVWGRAERQKGHAKSASQGLVGFADFSTRPLQRIGELTEVVPGMVATQHSGEGKANQYFLRGFNLDHGTDFSGYFAGMPINMRAHAHGHGYLDLNFLIPEVISTVSFSKGPYRADRGDFSTAGTSTFNVYERIARPFIQLEGGSDNYFRSVAAGSTDFAAGHLMAALEMQRNDGPWTLASDVEKYNLLSKYSYRHDDTDYQLILSIYDNEWRATDQIPQRLVNSNTLDRFDFVDPNTGGNSQRISLIGGAEASHFKYGGYISRYELNLFGNFTYFLEDPINGDQHEQVDRRWIYGGYGEYRFDITEQVQISLGTDFRYDNIGATNLYQTTARVRRTTTRDDNVKWASLGLYANVDIQLSEQLRLNFGLRSDTYDYDVDAQLAANSGDDRESNFIPSLNIAYELNDHIEVYLNWGEGFHSNDVRGGTISVDPISGDPVDPINLFVDQEGAEIGVRLEGWQGLSASLTYFWLESDSELLFVGDSGSTEASDGSERTGFEIDLFWNINQNWTMDVVAAFVDSKFTDVPSQFEHIPNAHGRVIGAGLTYVQPQGLTASVRVRHFGDAPLIEDNSVSHGETTVVNLGVAYQFADWEVGIDLINLFDAEDDDIAYFFESQLGNETNPVEDVHFHPVDPFSVRFNIKRTF